MQLFIIIQRAGTMREFPISPGGGFTDDVLILLDAQKTGALLKADGPDMIEITPERLLELRISPMVSVIDGATFDANDEGVEQLAAAQSEATKPGARMYLSRKAHAHLQG